MCVGGSAVYEMVRHWSHALFIFSFVFCSLLRSSAYAGSGSPTDRSVEVLQLGGTTDGGGQTINVKSFYSPFLVATDNNLLAVAGANCDSCDSGEEFVDILTSRIETNGNGWVDKITEKSSWEKRFVVREKVTKKSNAVKGLVAAAKGNQLFFLFVNASTEKGKSGDEPILNFGFAVGEASGDSMMRITWQTDSAENKQFVQHLRKKTLSQHPFSGSALVVEGEKLALFLLRVRTVTNNIVSSLIGLDESGKTLKFSYLNGIGDCYPHIFSLERKIIMIPTHCPIAAGDQKIKESTDMGNTWADTQEPISRLAEFIKDKEGFTTIAVDYRKVLLLTQQTMETQSVFKVNLWMTDGSRMSYVGNIFAGNELVISHNIAHTKGELLSLHQTMKGDAQQNITLTLLKEQMEKIKTTLDIWKKTNYKIMQLCRPTPSFNEHCSTDGLVGFLSNSTTASNEWEDEYLYTNAKVTKGKKANSGFTFDEPGAGARWPVGKGKNDQFYNLAKYGFTLLATVRIDSAPTHQRSSLLGVSLDGDRREIGLWCTAEGRWAVVDGDKSTAEHSKTRCERRHTYQVAMKLSNGDLVMYVEGEPLRTTQGGTTRIKETDRISHFYFGGSNSNAAQGTDAQGSVTVTNVLLYNRALAEETVKNIRIKAVTERETADTSATDGSREKSGKHKKTENEEKELSSRAEDNAVCVGVFFLLFGVIVLLESSVYCIGF